MPLSHKFLWTVALDRAVSVSQYYYYYCYCYYYDCYCYDYYSLKCTVFRLIVLSGHVDDLSIHVVIPKCVYTFQC